MRFTYLPCTTKWNIAVRIGTDKRVHVASRNAVTSMQTSNVIIITCEEHWSAHIHALQHSSHQSLRFTFIGAYESPCTDRNSAQRMIKFNYIMKTHFAAGICNNGLRKSAYNEMKWKVELWRVIAMSQALKQVRPLFIAFGLYSEHKPTHWRERRRSESKKKRKVNWTTDAWQSANILFSFVACRMWSRLAGLPFDLPNHLRNIQSNFCRCN